MNRNSLALELAGLAVLPVLLVVLVGCGSTPTPEPRTTPAPVILASVTAKGVLVPVRYARVSFGAAGRVAALGVKEGDRVKAGDLLAQLDTRDLELAVKAAQDAVDLAASMLAQAKTPASAQEIASAQAAYDSAAAALARAERGPTEVELAILRANLGKAKAALDQAQAAYDRAGGANNPDAGMLPTSLALQAATFDYQIVQANYDQARQIDPTEVRQARAALAQAKAALELKQKGPRPEDIAVVQVRVQQAQTGLQQAQAALSAAKLVAPFDGTITGLNLYVGEWVQPGAPLITLGDLSQLHVETTDLDEVSATKITVGQPVSLTVNAFDDKTLTGKVESISFQSTILPTGDTAYTVDVALDRQDPELRWGMTVKVQVGVNK